MEVKSKFNVNDKVYLMVDNSIKVGTIVHMRTDTSEGPSQYGTVVATSVTYVVEHGSNGSKHPEASLFSTKEGLCDYLFESSEKE